MKLLSNAFSFVILCTMSISAQEFLNFYANLGYGFGMGGYYIGSSNNFVDDEQTPINTEDHFLNLGHGVKFEIGCGVMLLPFLEGRLGLDFTQGAPSPEINSVRSNDVISDTVIDYRYSSYALKVIFSPYFEVLDLVDMYIGTGLVLNFANSVQEITITSSEPEIEQTATLINKTPLAIGFIGLTGFELPLTEIITFFSEVRFEQMNHKLVRQQIDAVSNFPDLLPISYEKDDIERDPPPNIPATNWGLRFGLKMWLL